MTVRHVQTRLGLLPLVVALLTGAPSLARAQGAQPAPATEPKTRPLLTR